MGWVQALVRWLRRLVRRGERQSWIRVLEQYHAPGASVLRLHDPSIPGSVELWRIDRHYEDLKFFICVINIAKLRQELGEMGDREARREARRGVAADLWEQVHRSADICATHFWITGWDTPTTGIDRHGRYYRSRRLADVELLAVDLQGVAGAFAGDRYALRFARKIILQLAANEFRELGHHVSWQAAVRRINWLQWLEGLATSTNGIAVDHVLQPKRTRSPGRRY